MKLGKFVSKRPAAAMGEDESVAEEGEHVRKRPAMAKQATGKPADGSTEEETSEGNLRNRVKARRWEELWNAVPGSDEHGKSQPVKERVLVLKAKMKEIGKWTKEQPTIINGFFEKNTLGRWEPQYSHPMFEERRFREEVVFDRDWHEGELREVVEQRINPVVLENLIQIGKVTCDGLMVFLPRKTVGVEKKWSKQDIGSRNKAIDDQQFSVLASGIDACIEGRSGSLHGLEIANHASGSHGTTYIGIGGASNVRCTVFQDVIVAREANTQGYAGVKDKFEGERIAFEKGLKSVQKIVGAAFDDDAMAISDARSANVKKLLDCKRKLKDYKGNSIGPSSSKRTKIAACST